MSPALPRLSVVCSALLLSLSHGTQLFGNDASVVQTEATKSWPGLIVNVTHQTAPFPFNSFVLYANPVVTEDGAKVLYDVNAEFKVVNSAYQKWMYYVQTDGYAMSGDSYDQTTCMEWEAYPYALPAVNAIATALMGLSPGAEPDGHDCPGHKYFFQLFKTSHTVCETNPGKMITITGNNLVLTVSYADKMNLKRNGGSSAGCKPVAFPASVAPIGKSLLTGQSLPRTS
uniref:Uncharacterized protein n=1 Tax=Peronospora matthiolae TaxID=2874970 RepID=A0AAV1UFK3_9STRA